MESTNLYQRILGLTTPWRVVNVDLDLKKSEVRVLVEHDGVGARCCPECGKPCPGYDHTRRSWGYCQELWTAR